MATQHPYPHLAPELRRLGDDALLLWGDARERRHALMDMLAAWDAADVAALSAAVDRVDGAVAAALQALGLGREPGARVQVGGFGRRWMGRVAADGTIMIDLDRVRQHLTTGRHQDRVFRTWAHESLHARQPASATRFAEYASWPGYEEGLVEGLARLVAVAKAGMADEESPYDYYVEAYRSLAHAGNLDLERLWRGLWLHRPGEVRTNLAACVDRARNEQAHPSLTQGQRSRLMMVADRVFAGAHYGARTNAAVLARLWEAVFR